MKDNAEETLRKILNEEGNSIGTDKTALQKIFTATERKTRIPKIPSRILLGGSVTAAAGLLVVGLLSLRNPAELNVTDQAASETRSQMVTYEQLRTDYEDIKRHPTVQNMFETCATKNGGLPEEYNQLRTKEKAIMTAPPGTSQHPYTEFWMLGHSLPQTEAKLFLNEQDSQVEFDCLEETELFENSRDTTLADIDAELTAISNQIQEDKSNFADAEKVANLDMEQLTCVSQNGYPNIEKEMIAEGKVRDAENRIPGTNVSYGEFEYTDKWQPSANAETRLNIRTTLYIPTEAEMEIGKVFLDCGETTGVFEKLTKIYHSAEEQALLKSQNELKNIQKEIRSFRTALQ